MTYTYAQIIPMTHSKRVNAYFIDMLERKRINLGSLYFQSSLGMLMDKKTKYISRNKTSIRNGLDLEKM